MYLQGFQVDTSKSISDTVTTSYEVTGISDTTRIEVNENTLYAGWSDALKTGISALFSANCETGETSVDSNGEYYFQQEEFDSFDPGRKPTLTEINDPDNTDATVTDNSSANPFPSGVVNTETSHCYTYFSSSDRTSFVFDNYSVSADSQEQVAASSSTESDKLSGIGLQFGYRGEKWRASFTHYTGQGGDNELTNSLIMADYFFQEKFFVGAGLASIKLTNSSAEGDSLSASATSPVLQVGYTEKLASNLQLSIGVLQYSSGLSLSSTTTTTTPIRTDSSDTQTATNEGDSATIGVYVYNPGIVNVVFVSDSFDWRAEVTQVGERTVNIEEIVTPAGGATIEAELKAPTVISISLHLSF